MPSTHTTQSPRSIQYLYILSHMRSRSTLLAHILGSNAQIDGYTELHQSYWSRLDLARMAFAIRRSVGHCLTGQYRLDKLLHNFHRLSPALIKKIQPHVIFMLRSPGETFASLHSFGQQRKFRKRYTDNKKMLGYYMRRLQKLEAFSRYEGIRGIYVDSLNLVRDTETTLHRLTGWLQLEAPLSSAYSHFRFTGTNYKGDTSEHIRAGRVLTETSSAPHECPEELLEQAHSQYLETRGEIIARCGGITPLSDEKLPSGVTYAPAPTV